MNRFLPIFILFLIGLLWGLSVPLTKIAVSSGHHPLGLIFWQSVGAFLLLGLITRIRKSRLVFDRSHIVFFTVIALTGSVIPNSTSYWAAFHLPGGVIALALSIIPMFSLSIALIFRFEVFQFRRFFGICLGAVAVALIVLPETSLPDPSKSIFVLVALVAPFLYAVEGNYLSVAQPAATGPITTIFGASIIGIIVSLPLSIATGTFIDPRVDGIGMPELALFATIALHVTAYTGYVWIVGKSGAVFASQVAYIVTPAGVLLSMVLLSEQPSHYIWIALATILVGLFLVQPRGKPDDQPPV